MVQAVHAEDSILGRVVALWRYPVKSMQGEAVNQALLSERGILGDRALALLDVETGKVAIGKLACVGVGGLVKQAGMIRRGDTVTFADAMVR